MLVKLQEIGLRLNILTDKELETLTETQLLVKMLHKINEIIDYLNSENSVISDEVRQTLNEWLNNGKLTEIINETVFTDLSNKIKDIPVKTPQDYGCKCDGYTDDGDNFINAMYQCAQNGYILMINKKVLINHDVVYDGYHPLTIIGKNGRYNDLTSNTSTIGNLPCDIYLGQGVNLEINKLGAVSFIGVGFGSHSKEYGGNIRMCSFSNLFLGCSFHQMNKAIFYTTGAKNWLGENKIALCQFHRCGYAVYSESGSDSEFTDNLIHGSCDRGFWGSCPGWNITGNHFYTQYGNRFVFFNTQISNNYIQEIPLTHIGYPTVTLAGSFGCQLNNNRFELVSDDDREMQTSLVHIETRNGGGNIQINSNNIHGKSLRTIGNLSFLKFTPPVNDTKVYDMPISMSDNHFMCVESILEEPYPIYNFESTFNALDAYHLVISGGTVTENTSEIINGVNYCKVVFESFPNYENIAKLSNAKGHPGIGVLHYTKADGKTGRQIMMSDADWNIKLTNYAELQGGSGTLYFQYRINTRASRKWTK